MKGRRRGVSRETISVSKPRENSEFKNGNIRRQVGLPVHGIMPYRPDMLLRKLPLQRPRDRIHLIPVE